MEALHFIKGDTSTKVAINLKLNQLNLIRKVKLELFQLNQ